MILDKEIKIHSREKKAFSTKGFVQTGYQAWPHLDKTQFQVDQGTQDNS